MEITESLLSRFWSKVDKRGPDDCWEWQGTRMSSGYGNFGVGNATITAHRASIIIHGVDIPSGMHVLHKCDNKPCVNPRHLYVGTQQDNSRDMAMRGQLAIPNLKLTPDDVREIRRMYAAGGLSYRKLAKIYGVDRSTVRHAINGNNWGYIDDRGKENG